MINPAKVKPNVKLECVKGRKNQYHLKINQSITKKIDKQLLMFARRDLTLKFSSKQCFNLFSITSMNDHLWPENFISVLLVTETVFAIFDSGSGLNNK